MHAGDDMAWSTNVNIYLVSAKGSKARCITRKSKAADMVPSYSPDGSTIAYLAMEKPGFEADRLRIKLYDRKTKVTRTLTEEWDRSVESIVWAQDSQSLVVIAEEEGRVKVFSVDAETGKTRNLIGDHHNSEVTVFYSKETPEGRIAFLQDSFLNPADVWVAEIDGSRKRRLTHTNDDRMEQTKMALPEEFEFAGASDEKVHAWIIKPIDFKKGKKYPVAFVIHGGPQGAFVDGFSYRWNPEVFASAGYAVIMVNFHGSTGFGQAFTDSISGDWGGKPYEDLMKGLDYALGKYDWLDGTRVAALGASYGGYMVNWINGHTDRFKCLVNHDGIFDSIGMYFTTEELWFEEWEHGGVPWENPELYEKFSPSNYVENWKTPTLVIHGTLDYRVPDGQGLAAFTALQRRGIPSKLLVFPDENHWVMKPKNSIVWHETVLSWLDQWVGPNG
jgi:dipeptidyl aminopeptidase/acylaminoacyl peptidase